MVGILKRYIQAERFGVWNDHLVEAHKMLPFLVAARHTNYTACLPLPQNVPAVYEAFQIGNFNVDQVSGPFNGVWTDIALEQTYNT